MRDGLLPEDDPLVKLELFEGPLDLLIHLIKVNEVDIMDLPMEAITKQYLETLRQMGKMELPVAGEYFVMAAELLRIKSLMLLPGGGRSIANLSDVELDSASGPDPRAELVKQLLEYQTLKTTAKALEAKWDEQALSYTCKRLTKGIEEERPLKPFDRFEMMGVFSGVVRRLMEKIAFGEIMLDNFTVSHAIEKILSRLDAEKEINLSVIIEENKGQLGWMAALFVATLELTRLGELALTQSEAFGEITLKRLKAA